MSEGSPAQSPHRLALAGRVRRRRDGLARRAATAGAIVAAGGFAIAGALCVANAVQCRRTHCIATGPMYLVAAALFVARAAGAQLPAEWIVGGAALGTVLAYVPEWLGRPYLRGGGRVT